MKFILALVSALTAISQISALVFGRDNATATEEKEETAACNDPRYTMPLLRAYNSATGDHLYTASGAEIRDAITRLGYVEEGITGYIFSLTRSGRVPLHRLYQPETHDHFYTTSAPERDNAIHLYGYASQGISGYCYPDSSCGGLPLYRSWNPSASDHFYTLSEAEKNSAQAAGWDYEGITCYMYPY